MKKMVSILCMFLTIFICSICSANPFEDRIKNLVEKNVGQLFLYESSNIDENGLVCIHASARLDPKRKVILWANSSADLLIMGSVFDRQGNDLTLKEYNKVGGVSFSAKPASIETINDMQRNMSIINELRKDKDTQEDRLTSLAKVRSMYKNPEEFDALYNQIQGEVKQKVDKSDKRIVERLVKDPELKDWLNGGKLGIIDQYESTNPKNTIYILSSVGCHFCKEAQNTIIANIDTLKEKQVAIKWVPVVNTNTEDQIKKAALTIQQQDFDIDPTKSYTVTEESLKKAESNTIFFKSSFKDHRVPVVFWESSKGIQSIAGFPTMKFAKAFIDTVSEKGTIDHFVNNALLLNKKS